MIKKIKFQSSEFLPILTIANKAIVSKTIMPVLYDFRIETYDGNNVAITASDGETWLTMEAKAIEAESGIVLCVEAKALLQVVSNLAKKEITMEIDDEKQSVTLRYDKGRCTLPYDNASDYPKPKVDVGDTYDKLPSGVLNDAIGRASFAVANDELRQVMNGVHFDFFSHGLVSVATDARKLVKLTNLTITHDGSQVSEVRNFTLPTKPCNILLSLLPKCEEDISYWFDSRNVVFKCSAFCMIARLVEGHYPNYDAVIPRQNTKTATISKEDFLAALKHVMPMSDSSIQLIALKFSTVITSEVEIVAQDLNFNRSASEHVDCAYDGEDITIGFNGTALMQLVQNIPTERFILEMDTPQRAGVIKESIENGVYDYVSIIMPVLVNA